MNTDRGAQALSGFTIQHVRKLDTFIDRNGTVKGWPMILAAHAHAAEVVGGIIDKCPAFVRDDWRIVPVRIEMGHAE